MNAPLVQFLSILQIHFCLIFALCWWQKCNITLFLRATSTVMKPLKHLENHRSAVNKHFERGRNKSAELTMCVPVILILFPSPAVPPGHPDERSKCPDIQLQRDCRGAEHKTNPPNGGGGGWINGISWEVRLSTEWSEPSAPTSRERSHILLDAQRASAKLAHIAKCIKLNKGRD